MNNLAVIRKDTDHVLIGKIVTHVLLAEDKQAIKFHIQNGESIVARADGDCCSYSWIENIENWEVLIGSPVLSVEDLEMPEPFGFEKPEYDVIAFYGLKITTVKGNCIIDYRNSSNGYYGGNLVWDGEKHYYFYGGVYGQNISKENWVILKPED